MKGKLYTIHEHKPATSIDIDAPPSLETLREIVGGNIQAIPYLTKYGDESCVAFCNEDGKLNGLPINMRATEIWADNFKIESHQLGDVLVGKVAIVTGDNELMEAI